MNNGFYNVFDILVRDEDGRQVGIAVKRGFCWPGLIFTFLWAFTNRLWGEGTVLVVVITAFNIGYIYFVDEMLIVGMIFALFNLVVAVVVGLNGNSWHRTRLERNGFCQLETVTGSVPKILSARSIAPAPSQAYSMGAVVMGTIFTNIALFFIILIIVSSIYGERSFIFPEHLLMLCVPAILLWIRAFRPPMGFLRGLGVTLGGMILGSTLRSGVIGLFGTPEEAWEASTSQMEGWVGLGMGLGLGLLLTFLGFIPKRRKEAGKQ